MRAPLACAPAAMRRAAGAARGWLCQDYRSRWVPNEAHASAPSNAVDTQDTDDATAALVWYYLYMQSREESRKAVGRQGRMDFVIEPIETNSSGKSTIRMKPDPRRYDKIEKDGEVAYLDRYLKVLIPLSAMVDAMRRVPIYSLSPSVKDMHGYLGRRASAMERELSGADYVPPAEAAIPHSEFRTDSGPRDFTFVSVDICGASAYRSANPEGFDRVYTLFTKELGTLVGQFNASILKTKGDGFIAFIDHPAFTLQCDNTCDLGTCLLAMVRSSLNPALSAVGLSPINIRVGADFGPAITRRLSIPATGFSHDEVFSDALNRAVKIEESCQPGQFRIGRDLYEHVHVNWLERSSEVPFDGATVGRSDYLVYEVR